MTDEHKLDQIGGVALSTRPTLNKTFEFAERCIMDGVAGDFVECGVFAGAQCAVMAYACQKHNDNRKVHLFDSFAGIPKPTEKDGEAGKLLEGKSVCSIGQVKEYMSMFEIEPERLVYHKGWFSDTLVDITEFPIAILRLDSDLYESTKICLKTLYKYLVKGGFCIIDDYALKGCQSAVHDCLGYKIPITPIEGGLGPVYWRKH